MIFAGALVALAGCAFVFFHASDPTSSTVTPGGGVTQAERSEAESGESSFKTPGVQQNAATLTVDTSDLAGEKWSNAKKILEVRGADVSSIVVLTDDGKDVWDASKWTVESIAVEDGRSRPIWCMTRDRPSPTPCRAPWKTGRPKQPEACSMPRARP